MFEVSLLGTGGMMPLPNRFLTSLICRIKGKSIMIDCGECTQVSLKILGWGFKNIDVICFTHYHADHISGLPGILLTIGNSGRTEPLNLIGPPGLEHVVKSLCVIASELPFELKFMEYKPDEQEIFRFDDVLINSAPVLHSTQCLAYNIILERSGKFNASAALKLGIPNNLWNSLQRGSNVIHNGNVYKSEMVMGPPRKGIKICYCTDTRPCPNIIDLAKKSDLFICEGIYGENDKLDKAKDHKHMIFSEAATLAKKSNVKELWLTHYSPSLTDPQKYINSATEIFDNTIAAYDRITKNIRFDE